MKSHADSQGNVPLKGLMGKKREKCFYLLRTVPANRPRPQGGKEREFVNLVKERSVGEGKEGDRHLRIIGGGEKREAPLYLLSSRKGRAEHRVSSRPAKEGRDFDLP